MTENEQLELPLAEVAQQPIQAKETLPPGWWTWVEPCVWSMSMSNALIKGVKGGKWFSLIDKVYKPANLRRAFEKVKVNKGSAGVDHVSIIAFEAKLDENLERLNADLVEGKYRPQAVRRVEIPKPGSRETRPLGIPTVRDRVVQTALVNVLQPIFEVDFAEHSYGFRPGRGARDALRRVDGLLKDGYTHVVDADLKGYFDSIPHQVLMDRLEDKVADGRVLALIRQYLEQPIKAASGLTLPEAGTPQGAVISPLLANMVLDPLDKLMEGSGFRMTRYADDFVILCRTAEEAGKALSQVQTWVSETGLTLHPEKTHIVDIDTGEGFDFLGYKFSRHKSGRITRYVRKKSVVKFKDTVRAKTSRLRGDSMEMIIEDLNIMLKGWFVYFKHAHKHTFRARDSFVRRRLRRILRVRIRKRRGTGQSFNDHQDWPNAFFEKLGLFSLEKAYSKVLLPLMR